ncbi:DUF6541 family protein [Microbacterium sp.]|uniref:DUF6541 family protein n=1 Tax=Microbacterium sp. TaxID=51671 RepID=UPI003A8F39A9
MILDWLAQAPVLLGAVLIVFLPGIAALYAVRMRGLALLATAPLFSTAATAIIAMVLGAARIAWSPLSWGIASLTLVGLAVVLGRLMRGAQHERGDGGRRWLIPTALTIGIILGTWRLVSYISDPSGISQTNDAVFHMNAVRYILDTGDASSMHVNAVIGASSFYPAAWHGTVALIAMATGAAIPVAANMLTLVIGALIWTLGLAWLARAVTGSNTVAAYTAVLAGALQTFPLLMFQWGVLFPNALSTAMIPAAIGVLVTLPRWTGSARWATVARALLLVLVSVAALALAQPAGILPWAAITAVWLSGNIFARRRALGPVVTVVAIVSLWGAVIGMWLGLSSGTSGSHWAPISGKLAAVVDVLLNGQVLIPFAFVISLLMLIGLALAVRSPRLRWFAVAWAGISVLYLLVAAVGAPLIRNRVLGAWYADPYRIAALAPIVVIPLAALGLDGLVRLVARRLHRVESGAEALVGGMVVATVVMIVLILIRPVAMPAVTQGTYDRDSRYIAASDSYLSPDRRALLERLPEHVPAGARVLGNPSTGSGFGYFLSGVDVFPRTWSAPQSPQWRLLAQSLRDAASDPAVCAALKAYGDPEYVLDFGPGEEGPGRYVMPGMTDFAGQPGFQRVDSVGDASLWRITACAQ